MPALESPPTIERSPIPAGKHRLTLIAVKDYESVNTFPDAKPEFNDETGEMEVPKIRKWIWQFQSTKADPKTNKPYEYAVFTPRYYSATSSKNQLTLLMRQLAPEASDEERKGLISTDSLIGRSWDAMLVQATSKAGKAFIQYNYFIPVEDAPREHVDAVKGNLTNGFDPDEVPF